MPLPRRTQRHAYAFGELRAASAAPTERRLPKYESGVALRYQTPRSAVISFATRSPVSVAPFR